MSLFHRLLENPFLFNLSQVPFSRPKFARILDHNDLTAVRSVLDVGCGPGTNAGRFTHTQYLGIDINPKYIELARRKFKRDFRVGDVADYRAAAGDQYDFVLVNSFLHHIDDSTAFGILANLSRLVSPDGHIHCVELVLPEHNGLTKWFAMHDRGKFARALPEWRAVFGRSFQTVVFEPFAVGYWGKTLMELVYFKGRTAR